MPAESGQAGAARWRHDAGGLLAVTVAFVGVYVAAVLTGVGQRADNVVVLAGFDHPDAWLNDTPVLHSVRPVTVAVAFALIVVVTIRRYGASALVSTALFPLLVSGAAEVVKRVLPRPELHGTSARLPVPSFPSGHVATALALWWAAIEVVPDGLRRAAIWVGAVWVVLVTTTSLTDHAHRVSDVIGSCLLVVGAWMLRRLLVPGARTGGATGRRADRATQRQLRWVAVVAAIAAIPALVVAMRPAWRAGDVALLSRGWTLVGGCLLGTSASVLAMAALLG